MHAVSSSVPAATSIPRRFWMWLAGLLLAFNAVATLPQPARLDAAELRAAALTAPTPAHAQFRDPGAAIKAAAQRSLKTHDHHDGDPPLPAHHAVFAPRHPAPATEHVVPVAATVPSGQPAARYRARAPPLFV